MNRQQDNVPSAGLQAPWLKAARRKLAKAPKANASLPLRQLPTAFPGACGWVDDFIPYAFGTDTNGDQIAFAHGFAPLWRYCPATGAITALDPRHFIKTDDETVVRGARLRDYDWNALDRVKARWGIRSW